MKLFLKLAAIAGVIYLIMKRNTILPTTIAVAKILQPFLQGLESFSSKPYRDYKQWSWGYGTRVPNSDINSPAPLVTISKATAALEMMKHVAADLSMLEKNQYWSRLGYNQQAAMLSFSYNEGEAAAAKMVNAYFIDSDNFRDRFSSYDKVTVNGQLVVVQDLVDRRKRELELFYS